MTTYLPPICMDCRFFRDNSDGFTCDAFPKGVPEPIIQSEHDHHKPYPGDHGIQFEPLIGSTLVEGSIQPL